MLPRNLHTALVATQVVAFATLVRSVAFDRWITVLGALLLITGATAALRGRTWGVALSLASAAAFPVAWALGMAPSWFLGVGVIGALPFALASEAMARRDRGATTLLALIAGTCGALTAVAWRLFVSSDAFLALPSLWPSSYPQHGLAVTALLAAGVFAVLAQVRRARLEPVRIGDAERVRVRHSAHDVMAAEAEAEAYDDQRSPLQRRR